MIQCLVVPVILKVRHPRIRKHAADSINRAQLFRASLPHGIQIEIEMPADHLRVGETNPRDSETKDQPRKCGVGRGLCSRYEILIRLFTETFHRHDSVTMAVQMENIIKFMDESRCDKLLQRHLGETVDIQRVPAHKQIKALDLFRLTIRIRTVEGLHIVQLADLRLSAAYRTGRRDITDTASCQVIRDLRNDHVRLVDRDPVSCTELQPFHDADVVDTGATYCGSFQLHRIKDCNRIDQSCPRRAPFNVGKRRLLNLIRPFKSDGISRKFCSPPQGLSVCDIII